MDELERLIARMPRPEPGEALDRRIDALLKRPDQWPDRRPVAPRKRGMWVFGFASAAAVIVALSFYLLKPDSTWAQVEAAVQSKPWIHLKTTAESQETREMWFSFPRDVEGWRLGDDNGEIVRFTDFRAGVRCEYDPVAKKLFRLPAPKEAVESFQSMSTLFRGIFRGEAPQGDRFAEDRIVGRKQRSVEENGQKWLEYELELQRGDLSDTVKLVIRVQPDTKLPVSMTISVADGSIKFEFDYPDEGPADIYALGIPRDTPIDDRLPPADLAQIIGNLNASRRDLDNYFAVVSGYLPQRFVWRKGDKWRVELCTRPVLPDETPKEEDQLPAWWREHLAGCNPLPLLVCDGTRVHRYEFENKDGRSVPTKWTVERTLAPGQGHAAGRSFGDSSHAMIEFEAFPELAPGSNQRITVDPTGPGGPPGSVLVEVNHDLAGPQHDDSYHRQRWWLDPKRQYVALKTEISNCPAIDRDPERIHKDETYEFDEFRQSPRGVWYPTLVRRKHTYREKDKDGVMQDRDSETHFFLDFSAPLPDELFTPTVRAPRP